MSTSNRRHNRVVRIEEVSTSLKPRPDDCAKTFGAGMFFTPMADLNLAIKNGWGETPQDKLPADWRTRVRKPPVPDDEEVVADLPPQEDPKS